MEELASYVNILLVAPESLLGLVDASLRLPHAQVVTANSKPYISGPADGGAGELCDHPAGGAGEPAGPVGRQPAPAAHAGCNSKLQTLHFWARRWRSWRAM